MVDVNSAGGNYHRNACSLSCQRYANSLDPDLIFRKSTTFKFLTPNDKLAVYGIDDPVVEGVACHYTTPEKGGLSGALGLAEQTSDISLACRQYRSDQIQREIFSGRCCFQRTSLDLLQENANRQGLRHKNAIYLSI